MGYYPTSVKVYIDFAHGAFGLTETWTEVTQWVTGRVRYEWGRSSAVDDFQPGKGSFTLINDDSRFDPSNSSGPYYGTLKPRRRCKITATVGANVHQIAHGWIEGWPQRWEGRRACYVDVTFTTGVFSQVKMPESVWDWRVKSLDPYLWYKLGDTDTPFASDSSDSGLRGEWRVFEGGGSPLTGLRMPKAVLNSGKVAAITPSSDRQAVSWASLQADVGQPLGGIVGVPRTPVFVPAWETQYLPDNAAGFGVVMWVLYRQSFPVDIRNIYSSTTPMLQPLITWGQYGSHWWEFYLTATGQLGFILSVGAATAGVAPIGSSLDDGQPHMLAFSKSTDIITVYVDGASKVSIYVGDNKPYPVVPAAIGVAAEYPSGLQSTIGDVAFWDRALLALEVNRLWYAGKYGSTSTFVETLETDDAFTQGFTLAEVDLSKTLTSFSPAGQSVAETISGQSFADYLRKLGDTEQGLIFWDRTGTMMFHGRDWPLRTQSKTVQFEVGDHAGATLGFADLGYRDPSDDLQNDVTVDHPSGTERSINQASVDDYGPVEGSVDTYLSDPGAAREVANLRAWKHGTPPAEGIIPDRLIIQPNTQAEFDMVCGLDIVDRVRATRTRPNGTQLVDDYWVQSIAHDFDAELGGEWTTVAGLSLADHPAAPFILDSSLLDSADALWI